MKGSIRMLIGLIVVLGAVGKLDASSTASVLVQGMLALLGLGIFYFGVRATKSED